MVAEQADDGLPRGDAGKAPRSQAGAGNRLLFRDGWMEYAMRIFADSTHVGLAIFYHPGRRTISEVVTKVTATSMAKVDNE